VSAATEVPVATTRAAHGTGALAASLTALAEAGIIFIPLSVVARESTLHASDGPFSSYPAFATLFVAATAVATAGRQSRWFVPAALAGATAVALLELWKFGDHTATATAVAAALSLLLALRVVTLGLRDWREPIQGSFGWGAGILLVEILLGGRAGFDGFAWMLVPLFFAASVASRAASLRLAEGTEVVGKTSMPWLGLGGALAGTLVALGAAATLLGGQGGLLERLGRFVPLALYGVIYAAVFVLSWILRPIGWALHALGFHSLNVGRLTGHIQHTLRGLGRGLSASGQPGVLQRLLGLAFLAGVMALLAWLVAQQRKRWVQRQHRLAQLVEPRLMAEAPGRPGRARRARRRRELPEDTIRRWYAEALIELERRGVPKVPWRTPAEFLGEAGEAFPEVRASLTALTRAYEEVRYGSRTIGPDRLDLLEAHRGVVLGALRPPRRRIEGAGIARPLDRGKPLLPDSDIDEVVSPNHAVLV
jgi:hypothetical protein